MRLFLLALCFVHGGLVLASASVLTGELVQSWVEDGERPLTSVEGFLERLPPSFFHSFVLATTNRSLQRASPTKPRLIFYGRDARFLVAVSGDPQDPLFQTAEMIEYLPGAARFRFLNLSFANGRGRLEIDPQRCHACHRDDGRPNWDPYNVWPHIYGGLGDEIRAGTREATDFQSFLGHAFTRGRYLKLPRTFFLESTSDAGKGYFLHGDEQSDRSPASALSVLLERWNRDRIAKRLARFRNRRAATLSLLLGCPTPIEGIAPWARGKFSLARLRAETRQALAADLERRLGEMRPWLSRGGKAPDSETLAALYADAGELRPERVAILAGLRYLFDDRAPLEDFSLGLRAGSLSFNDGLDGLDNLAGHFADVAYTPAERSALGIALTPTVFMEGAQAIPLFPGPHPSNACERLASEAAKGGPS